MKTIFLSLNVTVLADYSKNIIEVRWHGIVPIEDCKSALVAVRSSIEKGCFLIMNRQDLEGFTPEASQWIRTSFFPREAFNVIPLISKLARIEKTGKISLVNQAINGLTSFFFPNLSAETFISHSEAYRWFTLTAKESFFPIMTKKAFQKIFNSVKWLRIVLRAPNPGFSF